MRPNCRSLFLAASLGALALSPANATEPGSFGNALFGGTVGAPVAAPPPPGLFYANTTYYVPNFSGNGNTGCGAGCSAHYGGLANSGTITWSTGMTFLGAQWFPTIQTIGYEAHSTTTAFVPGGGPGSSPLYGETVFYNVGNIYFNPVNFSWKLSNAPFFFNAGIGFVAPSGTTYAGALMPDYWTIRPHAALTYLGDGWDLTANAYYDINTASGGNVGLYQIIARNPTTPAATAAFLGGPNSPGNGYTSGSTLFLDFTATHRFDKWEVGPVGYVKYQVTNDTPGGINPGTGSAWTCAQLTAARLPTCGRDHSAGAGLLVGYNFGPVDVKAVYLNTFYSKDTIGAPTGSSFILKTSFRLWDGAAQPAPTKGLITKN